MYILLYIYTYTYIYKYILFTLTGINLSFVTPSKGRLKISSIRAKLVKDSHGLILDAKKKNEGGCMPPIWVLALKGLCCNKFDV